MRAYTEFIDENSRMSIRKTPQRSTCCRSEPAALRIDSTLRRQASVCASIPSGIMPDEGSRAPWPETKMRRSKPTAGEYGPSGVGAADGEIRRCSDIAHSLLSDVGHKTATFCNLQSAICIRQLSDEEMAEGTIGLCPPSPISHL